MITINKFQPLHFLFVSLIVLLFTSCKKEDSVIPPHYEFGQVADVDGNSYLTIKIGNQWWMAEDLKTTKYQDSSFISLVAPPPNDTSWPHFTSGAYCNNLNSQGILIGRFYNWYAINDARNIAPRGWHVPSDDEWKLLEIQLGMSLELANLTGWRGTDEGEKLKVVKGTIGGWSDYDNVWATNESGFSALSAGCRMFDGSWADPGQYATGFWWSSTANGNEAWYRYLDYKKANVFRYHSSKNYGFSVRCVKD